MLKEFWCNYHKSICSITHFNNKGEKIGSGTGFKANNLLLTNNHVYNCPESKKVEVKFMGEDGNSINTSIKFDSAIWNSLFLDVQPESSWDYAILSLKNEDFNLIPNLVLEDSLFHQIGTEVVILGFQLDQENLSMKKGTLSSKYSKAGVNYLQIDASVNNGNSGGPLLNLETGKVIGIVTRKYTGLTESFNHLLQSFDKNVEYLTTVVDYMSISGFRPIEPSIWIQNQLKLTAQEIYRSSNVGIGLAYSLTEINKYFDKH